MEDFKLSEPSAPEASHEPSPTTELARDQAQLDAGADLNRRASPADEAERAEQPRTRAVNWTTINYWVDFGLLCLFLALWWSTLVLIFVFPPGPYAIGWQLWGWDYTHWLNFQLGVLSAFTLGVLIHLMFHWTWVVNVTLKLWSRKGRNKSDMPDDGLRTLYGVGALIAALHIVGLAIFLAKLMVQPPPG